MSKPRSNANKLADEHFGGHGQPAQPTPPGLHFLAPPEAAGGGTLSTMKTIFTKALGRFGAVVNVAIFTVIEILTGRPISR